jgi:regulator of RNase E activity RraA
MYIQQPKELPSACWGGLMSTRAQQLDTLGVNIDGRMRDRQEHRDISFPVCQIQYYFGKFELYQLTNMYRSLRGEPPS